MSYPEYSEFSGEGYKSLNRSAKTFSFDLATGVFESEDRNDNFAISPISVYAALALAAECAGGETRDQIVSALNTTYDALYQNYGLLIRSLQREFDTGKLTLYNSVWLDARVPFRQSAVNTLSEKYYCYSYSADFAGDNDKANKAIRYHVKKQTNGLIERDFDLSTETLFTLISSLYLKDNWLRGGDDISLTAKNHTFKGANGEKSENSAALTVHLAAKGEGIWEVAKSAGCPPDDIMRQNPDLTLPLQGGERILIYRSVKEKF